ncbi:hypothetical protein D3C80_976220 [compost metagenome]
MRQKRAGRIKFLAIDDDAVTVMGHFRLKIGDGLAFQFGKGVTITNALKRPAKKQLLLVFRAVQFDSGDNCQMVLCDLSNGGIGRRNRCDDRGKRGV